LFLGRISFVDYYQYMYNYFPGAKYVGLIYFGTPTVLVRDPELIRDIMVKAFEYFPNHRSFVDESVDPLYAKNTFFLRGDRWREMRNTLSPTFTVNKMKFMFDLISKCSQNFVDYFVDHPEICHAIETKGAFRRYTNDVIATTAFGISVNSMRDQNNEFYMKAVEATKFSGLLTMAKLIILRTCPLLAKSIGLTFFSPATSMFFKKIVAETIKAREEQNIIRPDMIHLLMQALSAFSSLVSIHLRHSCVSSLTNWRLIEIFRIVCARRCNSILPKKTVKFRTSRCRRCLTWIW